MKDLPICPTADPAGMKAFNPPFNGEMVWRENNTCSYCGSLNPDAFMVRLEAGDITLDPTDKDYKVYVANAGGPDLRGAIKFYFQHLSADQRARFIELHNERKLNMGPPGHFYVAPFFCKAVAADAPDDGA